MASGFEDARQISWFQWAWWVQVLWFWNGAYHTNGLYVHVTCALMCIQIYIYIVQGPLPKSSLFAVAQNRTRNDSRGTFHPESHHSWNVPFCTLINRVCDCRVSNNFKLCFGHDSPACFKCRAKHEPIAFGQPPFNQIGLTSSPALIILNLTSSTLQK